MKDLIERQVAIEGVKKSCLGVENVVQAEANAIEYIKRMPSAQPERYWIDSEGKISALPSAQPERKKGEWLEIEVMPAYDIMGVRTWASVMKCDTCGFETFAIEGHMAQYHFCPSCGARMDGESDG